MNRFTAIPLLVGGLAIITGLLILNPVVADESVPPAMVSRNDSVSTDDTFASKDMYLLAAAVPNPDLPAFSRPTGIPVIDPADPTMPSVASSHYSHSIAGLVTDTFFASGSNATGRVAIPEPGSIFLLGTGLFGIAAVWRRRSQRH